MIFTYILELYSKNNIIKYYFFNFNSTPKYDESRKTPRNQEIQNERATPRNRTPSVRTPSVRTPSYKSPRGTPFTNSSPRSMSLSGDGTPLYDES